MNTGKEATGNNPKRGRRIAAVILLIAAVAAAAVFWNIENKKKEREQNTLHLLAGQQKWWPGLLEALREEFPDLTFETESYVGPNTSQYAKVRLEREKQGDIYLGGYKVSDEDCKKYLLDLSGYSFVGNYNDSILNQYDTDGAIYQLPGLIVVRAMAYNRTLFEKKGWKKPKTHQELVALCRQIREEEPDITPIAFATIAPGYAFTTVTTLAQADAGDMAAFKRTESEYLEGNASAGELFRSGLEMTQELIDAGAYDVELDKEGWDTDAMARMAQGSAAMCAVWGSQNGLQSLNEEGNAELGLFPFYGKDEGERMLGTGVTANIGLCKNLGEKGNEKKLENAVRVMEYLTTEEGMERMRNGSSELIPLKGAVNEKADSIYKEVWEENLSGLKAPMLYGGYEDILVPAGEFILDAMRTGGSLDGLVELADGIHQKALTKPESVAYAQVERDFTAEETVQYITNALHTSGAADITLISASEDRDGVRNTYGVSGRMYAGSFGTLDRSVFLPRRFSEPLCVRELTGAKIKSLVQDGKMVTAESKSAYFDYYWAGMDVKFGRGAVVSMTFADGTRIEDDAVYRVQFAKDDYTPENPEADEVQEQELTPDGVFLAYLENIDTIEAPEVPERGQKG